MFELLDQLTRGSVTRQTARAAENGERVVDIATHAHFDFIEVTAMALRGDLQLHGIEGHTLVVTDGALKLLAQDLC